MWRVCGGAAHVRQCLHAQSETPAQSAQIGWEVAGALWQLCGCRLDCCCPLRRVLCSSTGCK